MTCEGCSCCAGGVSTEQRPAATLPRSRRAVTECEAWMCGMTGLIQERGLSFACDLQQRSERTCSKLMCVQEKNQPFLMFK